MPDAEDFEAVAAVLDAAAQEMGTLMEPVRAALGEGVMVGGALTQLVADEVDAASGILDAVAAELNRLADVCRQRAESSRQVVA